MTFLIKAQDYQISFTGSGQSTSVNSVFVENLTQGTTLELASSDILHLVGTVGIESQSGTNEDLQIYPNPMNETSKLEFYIDQPDDVKIEIYDMGGKLIAGQSGKVHQGTNVFEISGFTAGFYTANIITSTWQKSLSFVSVNDNAQKASITSLSDFVIEPQTKSLKSTKNLVEMQYNDGDILLFKGVAGDYARVLTKVPTQTQTIDFEFVACTDLGGNHYAVVSVGNQEWMAENLKYLPSVVGAGTGSNTTPYYYVYGYDGTNVTDAKATVNYTTYGVLYNWPAAMAGSASSAANPSGVQGVCPTGWHLPSDAEWTELTDYLGGVSVTGGKLKETGTTHWNSPNTDATNETGFTALPGGYRLYSGYFDNVGFNGYWWSATESDASSAWYRSMDYSNSSVYRDYNYKELGFSVRCLRD